MRARLRAGRYHDALAVLDESAGVATRASARHLPEPIRAIAPARQGHPNRARLLPGGAARSQRRQAGHFPPGVGPDDSAEDVLMFEALRVEAEGHLGNAELPADPFAL